MPAPELALSSTRVVTPDGVVPATVVVARGTIAEVAPHGETRRAREHHDLGDAVLMPGLVDTHVHLNEPGRGDWEGFQTGTRAAAAGGITTIVEMPLNSLPVTTSLAALEAKAAAAADRALVDYAFWGGAVPGNRDDLAPLAAAGVVGFKCFLVPSGIAEFPHVTENELRLALCRIAELDGVLLVHAELAAPIERAAAAATGDPRRYASYLGSRPPEAEVRAIELLIQLSRDIGCRVHIVHLSSAEPLAALAAARQDGTSVTVETCPHYLTFTAEEIPDGATAFKCAPPIREGENRERLWRGLSDGLIDRVVSDHSPCPPALKCLDTGDFFRAWGGIASLELSLAATWTAARVRGHTLCDVVRWMAEAPAQLAGLADRKGRLTPGYDADLVVFDPDTEFTVDPTRLHQRHPLTPYAGRRLRGIVRGSFVRGIRVFDGGEFPAPPRGRRLVRGAA